MKSDDNLLYFEPMCKQGNTLYHRHDKEKEEPLIAISFTITAINDKNEVIDYTVGCSNMNGTVIYFKPFELKKEEVEA